MRQHARRQPAAPALVADDGSTTTYSELLTQAEALAHALRASGFSADDRLAVVLPTGPRAVVFLTAFGGVANCAPIDPALTAAEYAAMFAATQPRALVIEDANSAAAAAARTAGIQVCVPAKTGGLHSAAESRSDSVMLSLLTSGTTGEPRLVSLTHRNVLAAARSNVGVLALTPADRTISAMPLFHIHGLSAVFASLVAGGSIVVPNRFDADAFLTIVAALGVSWFTAAPTIHAALLEALTRRTAPLSFDRLRFIRSASSAMPQRLAADLEAAFGVPLIEAYGMTEAAPLIASNRLPPSPRKPGAVGRAVGPDIRIVDNEGHALAAGDVGEICICGENVATSGWYRTGDLGYLDADGDLFVTGRLGDVINRGGEKIHPSEIEKALLTYPDVAAAVAFAVPHPTLGEIPAAAIVPDADRDLDLASVTAYLRQRLIDSKVPRPLLVVPSIPVDGSGKISRRQLPTALGISGDGNETSPIAVQSTAIERDRARRVAAIVSDVLGASVSPDADFFVSGGDSLRAAQVLAKVSEAWNVALPPNALYVHSSARQLAEAIQKISTQRTSIRANTFAPDALRPVSAGQRRLWIVDRLDPGNPAYNIQIALRLHGPLQPAILEDSLTDIRRRHESLRTTIVERDGEPWQRVSVASPLRLPMFDLTRMPSDQREEELSRLLADDAETPFHLAYGPLFRAQLLRIDANDHVLLLTTHHIVSDGWSSRILASEIAEQYRRRCAEGRAIAADGPLRAEPLPFQYSDWAAQSALTPGSPRWNAELAYWQRTLAGLPPRLDLPFANVNAERGARRSASLSVWLDAATTRRASEVAAAGNATLFVATLAAFQAVLTRATGQEDITVGVPVHGRYLSRTEQLVGFFANTIVLRGDLSGDPSLRTLLARTRTAVEGALGHQQVPFDAVVDVLHSARSADRTPLLQVMFAFQNLPPWPSQLTDEVTISPVESARSGTKFDLALYLDDQNGGLRATWQYDADLFDRQTIATLAGAFADMMAALARGGDDTVRTVALATPLSRSRSASSVTGRRDFTPAISLFEAQVARAPHAVAITSDSGALTYAQLDAAATRVAGALRKHGVIGGVPVGVCLPRSTDMLVALLAVMKSGGVYVPLDPEHPRERLAHMLADARVDVTIVADAETAAERPFSANRVLVWPWLSEGADPIDSAESLNCADPINGADSPSSANPMNGADSMRGVDSASGVQPVRRDDLAYVIYTSGSSGHPKGVGITHGNLAHYLAALNQAIGVHAADRCLHAAPCVFSSAIRQWLLPLSCGATIVLASSAELRDARQFWTCVADARVTVIDLVPSFAAELLAATDVRGRGLTDVRLVLSASETLTPAAAAEWRKALRPTATLINMYGQTETAGIVTTHAVAPNGGLTQRVPIGRPIPGVVARIVDETGREVPPGIVGELVVAGPTVGTGYLHDAEATAARFDGHGEDRTYRTGDLARQFVNGNLELLGRADRQIKIRGFRVEPEEVEAALSRLPGVRECAVVPMAGDSARLAAYIVTSPDVRTNDNEVLDANVGRQDFVSSLRRELRNALPAYLVPSVFVELDAFPRTATGKIDRTALPAADATALADDSSERVEASLADAPLDEIEMRLAAIWSALLGVARVNRRQNFFDLGGDSLMAIRMIEQVNRAGLAVPVKTAFQYQTIEELARACRSAAQRHDEPRSRADVRWITFDSMRAFGLEALGGAGLSADYAAAMTEVQIEASLRGQTTHNVGAIPRYARRLRSGVTNPRPVLRVVEDTPTTAILDGDNGPGQIVALEAMELAIKKASRHGMAIVGARRSSHFGAAGHYVWMAAQRGLIGLCTTNSALWLAPTGGLTPLFGTNPLGAAIPAGRHAPIVLDVSMSVTAKGKVALQLEQGKPIEPGWILDRFGRTSTDVADLTSGLGVPIGGHKGYGLALLFEILAGVLTGAGFASDHRRDRLKQPGVSPDFGHCFIAVDPTRFMPMAAFTARVDRLIDEIKRSQRVDGVDEVLVPGELEMRARAANLTRGVPVSAPVERALLRYRDEAHLDTDLVFVEPA